MKAIAIGFVFSAVISVTLAVNGAGAYSFVAGRARAVGRRRRAGAADRAHALPVRVRPSDRPAAARLRDPAGRRAGDRVRPPLLGLGDRRPRARAPSCLGFYLLAFNISSWVPGIVGTAVRYVSIPAFSRLAEGETDDFSVGVQRSLPLMLAVVAPDRRTDGDAVAGAGPRAVRRGLGAGGRGAPVPGVRDGGADVHGAGLRHPDGPGQHQGDGLAEPRLAGRPASGAVGRARTRAASAAPPIGHAVVALVVAIPLAGWLLHRSGVDMRPVLRRIVRPVLAAMAAGLTMAALARSLDSPFAQLVVAGGLGLRRLRAHRAPGAGAGGRHGRWVASFVAARRGARA